jgi:hypothetical protein
VETPAGGEVTGLLIQTDGKIVAIGAQIQGQLQELFLARYLGN